MEIQELYEIYCQHPFITTDTRKLQKGDLFFALKGPNFNGNLFAKQAIEEGAAYAIVDEEIQIQNDQVIKVNDSLKTLQQLAAHHRNQLNIPFIGITGSNGKTTTKELIHAVLSSHFTTYTTRGNLNNHIGVPITILNIRKDAEMAVIEMGANHLREIASYCEYTRPNFGLITNIGKAHLEGFGSADNVRKGKGELFDFFYDHKGHAFVNADDPNVLELSQKLTHKTLYGQSSKPSSGKILSSDPFLELEIQSPFQLTIKTHLVGNYNAPNVFAAVTIGHYFNVPKEKIKSAIENYIPANSRSQMMQQGSNTFILDAYNANPGSMKAAIDNFAAMKGDHKILILGDMKELGADSPKEHQAVIELLNHYTWSKIVLTGPEFAKVNHSFLQFPDSEAARQWFKNQLIENSLILIKGSRSMKMERVLE